MAKPSTHDLLRESSWVRSLARSLVGDAHLADDLVQEAYLRALHSPPDEAGKVRPWFRTVLKRLAFRSFAERQRRDARQATVARPDRVESMEVLLERVEQQRSLAQAAAELDDPYRQIVLLRYFQDLNSTEIGEHLGVPASTVRVQLRRALETLRKRLDSEYGDRETWCQALLPLALMANSALALARSSSSVSPESARAEASATTSGVTSIIGGGLLMGGIVKFVIPAVIVAGVAWWVVGDSWMSKPAAPSAVGVARRGEVAPLESRRVSAPSSGGASEFSASAKQPVSENSSSTIATTALCQGRVVDSYGEPLAGVRISHSAAGVMALFGEPLLAQTEEDGSFQFAHPRKRVALIFRKDGHESNICELPAVATVAATTDLGTLVLHNPLLLRGRVEGSDGIPIADAAVTLTRTTSTRVTSSARSGRTSVDRRTSRMSSRPVSTDASGRFVIDTFVGEEYSLSCEAFGWAGPKVVSWKQGSPPGDPRLGGEVVVVLEPAGVVAGLITFDDGAPAIGAEISLRGAPGDAFTSRLQALSDASGVFEIDGQPAGAFWMVDVSHPDAVHYQARNTPASETLNIRLTRGGGVEVVLSQGEAEALPNELTFSYRQLGGYHATPTVNRDGDHVELRQLEPARYAGHVHAPGFSTRTFEFVIESGKTTRIDALLEELQPLRLRVVDPEGELIQGAVVTAVGRNWQSSVHQRWTLADGTLASVELVRESLGLVVEADGYAPWSRLGLATESGGELVVALQPAFTVTFSIAGGGRDLAEGTRLGYSSRDPNNWLWILHSREGRSGRNPDVVLSEHRVKQGEVTLRSLPLGAFSFTLGEEEEQIAAWDLTLAGELQHTVVVAAVVDLEFRARVRVNGQPVTRGKVSLYRPTPAFRTEAPIDEEGFFGASIPAGEYWITFTPDPDGDTLYGYSIRRGINEESLNLDFAAVRAELLFIDADGTPAQITHGDIYNPDLGRFPIVTGADGKITLEQVPPGEYFLYGEWQAKRFVIPTNPAELIRVAAQKSNS